MRAFRLVNRMWNRQVLFVSREQGIPLVRLVLDQTRFVAGTRYLQLTENAIVPIFDMGVITGMNPGDKVPSFGVQIHQDNIPKAFAKGLKELIQEHGTSLAELDLTIWSFQSKNLLPEAFNLPVCRKIAIRLRDSDGSIQDFVEPLVKACPKLKEFSMPLVNNNTSYAPSDLNKLALPKSLTDLGLENNLSSNQLKILLNNQFSNLKHLTLQIQYRPYEQGLMFQVLSRVSESLEKLVLQGLKYDGLQWQPTRCQFPLMPQLKELWLSAYHLELEQVHGQDLGKLFPKLSYLQLRNQTEEKMSKWLEGSIFPSVTCFYPLPVYAAFKYSFDSYHAKINDNMVSRILKSFPFLTTLEFYLYPNNVNGLQSVFKRMDSLSNLHIYSYYKMKPEQWSAVLLGMRLHEAPLLPLRLQLGTLPPEQFSEGIVKMTGKKI